MAQIEIALVLAVIIKKGLIILSQIINIKGLLGFVNAFLEGEKQCGRIDDLADQYFYNAGAAQGGLDKAA